MVVLEAWANAKPVLMTTNCNLPEGFTANAAIRIEPEVDSLGEGLQQLFQTSSAELRTLGENGQSLVAERFTWPKIAANMLDVYEWALGGGSTPDCVVLQ